MSPPLKHNDSLVLDFIFFSQFPLLSLDNLFSPSNASPLSSPQLMVRPEKKGIIYEYFSNDDVQNQAQRRISGQFITVSKNPNPKLKLTNDEWMMVRIVTIIHISVAPNPWVGPLILDIFCSTS